jgi:hypothetical protein
MSDNVINLLRPFHRLDDRQDSPWHIRLPRLQKLELYGCRRSSGDAVVDAFTARFNNAAAYATLRELDYGLQPYLRAAVSLSITMRKYSRSASGDSFAI